MLHYPVDWKGLLVIYFVYLLPARTCSILTFMRLIILFILFVGLIGCATTPVPSPVSSTTPSPSAMTWDQRESALSNIRSWDLDAKIAIRNTTKPGADSANMQWKQTRQQYSILLFGPLGANPVHLRGNPGGGAARDGGWKKSECRFP